MKFATRYSPPVSPALEFELPSMTEQHFKDECDVNVIVAKAKLIGSLPSGNREPLFGDFEKFPKNLQERFDMYNEAYERFLLLPSEIRKRFGNNPVNLLDFLRDPANVDEAVNLGLLVRTKETNVSKNNNPDSPPPVDNVPKPSEA